MNAHDAAQARPFGDGAAIMLKNGFRYGVSAILLTLFAALVAQAQTPLKSTAFTPGSWSLVLLPDTQNYSERYPGLFTLQTHWIAKNKDKYNIRYVLGLGDVTNHDKKQEWLHAREAIGELDGQVPYALAAGNHDYTPHGNSASGKSGLNTYFPASKFEKWPTFGGAMKPGDMTNCYHLFSAGGADWIIVVLQWAPSDAVVKWANEVLAKHPKRKAILVTHAYLYSDSARYDFTKKGKSQKWNPHSYATRNANDGEELWRKLVSKNNFVLTFNGHVLNGGLGFLASKNDRGDIVHQMLVNYQMRELGGEGYLRILEFQPDGRTVHVKSYSPLYDKYLDDAGNQFSFELDR
jgi:hypothetical protein